MIKTEFGIIDDFDPNKEYLEYEPQRYNCVAIDDDEYINEWWPYLLKIPTYNMSIMRPQKALSRWGITLIPPESLPDLLTIVINDVRIKSDPNPVLLKNEICKSIEEEKYMIHYGI